MTSEVRESKLTGHNRLYIDPQDNVLIGSQNIMRYLGIAAANTLYNWVEVYALPAIKLPNGQWMTTMTAIDQWIFMAAELDAGNRLYSRGSNRRYDLALEQAQRRAQRAKEGKMRVGPLKLNDPFDETERTDGPRKVDAPQSDG